MSYNYQNKKRNSSDTSDSSASSSEVEKCNRADCYDQCRACIVCPPYDYKEKYDSSGSDHSCPDFTDLCQDKPRICCEKKSFIKKSHKKESPDSSDSSDSSDDDLHDVKGKKCRGCDRACGSCTNCRACGCRDCSDYSRSSVLNALGSSESASDCSNFDHLVCDGKRKCGPLFALCKRKDYCPDDSTKDASRNIPSEKKQFRQKRQVKHKPLVKQDSSSTKSDSTSSNKQSSSASSSSRGKKFVVSFGPKEGHQWAKYNDSDESIHINGKNGPVLHLYRGSTYFFCVEQSNVSDDSSSDAKHFFFLTDSPCGGIGSQSIQGGFAPVSKGCVCFKVDKLHTPAISSTNLLDIHSKVVSSLSRQVINTHSKEIFSLFITSIKHSFQGNLLIVHGKY